MYGITPADAGNRRNTVGYDRIARDHPRGCDLSLEKVLRIIDESKSKTEMLRKLREAMKDTEPNYINW